MNRKINISTVYSKKQLNVLNYSPQINTIMKNMHFIAALLLSLSLHAQIQLEHEYETISRLERVNFSHSGEKYYTIYPNNDRIVFYNKDHSFWKLVTLQIPSGSGNIKIATHTINEVLVQSEPQIILGYTFTNSASLRNARVINDKNEILLDVADAYQMHFDVTGGLVKKLFVYTDQTSPKIAVYNYPNLNLLHTFTSGSELRRYNFEISGEKYSVTDFLNNKILIYNNDYSLWKSIDLTLPPNSDLVAISSVSEKIFNSDNEIEVAYSYAPSGGLIPSTYTGRVINESGNVLATIPQVLYFINQNVGETIKILTTYGMSSNSQKVIDTDNLSTKHEFNSDNLKLVNFGTHGFKYCVYNLDNKQINLYNEDYTIWKTINVPVPNGASLGFISHISHNRINADNLIEFAYRYSENNSGNTIFFSQIANERGDIIFTDTGATSIRIDEINGLVPKIITNRTIGTSFSRVYSIDGATKTGLSTNLGMNNKYSVYPNPATTLLNIKGSNNSEIDRVVIIDTQGKEVYNQIFVTDSNINLDGIQNGIYTIKVFSKDGSIYNNKFVIEK